MSRIYARSGHIYLDFTYRNKRCREATHLKDTPHNRSLARKLLKQIEAEIVLRRFDYGKRFPNSPRTEEFRLEEMRVAQATRTAVRFADFSRLWFEEKRVEWRERQQMYMESIVEKILIPIFGDKDVRAITKAEILEFRSLVAKRRGHKSEKIGSSRINQIMNALRMIVEEAADRFAFNSPWKRIKPLAVKREEVRPFSLKEAMLLVKTVRPDYRNYLIVRFFTGLRSGEINGLMWGDVDTDRNTINVSRIFSNGKIRPPKNDAAYRDVHMVSMVRNAIENQRLATEMKGDYIFCSPQGLPVDNRNFRRRVWVPLLKLLGLEVRSPYQTRHTAATLWLSAGESPEWISRQMGHTTTEMLFRVYSRYIPNLTRQDGSALEKVLQKQEEEE